MLTIMASVIQLTLLAHLAKAYVPPAVEIPPVDQQARRGAGGHQVSYSYGTTAYQQVPISGYASAHLANHQRQQQGQQNQASAGQPTECQNPMLRVFFKHCHAPGSAPQSPVQCQPIPGQTTFRCMIKQQTSWPVVRITECPPGTAASSGQCVRFPGSFSTNGLLITPVSYPGVQQQIVHQQRTSNVYRHCANGQCQTCIGEQCSTTGLQTPVSVDHRGRANSSTEVVAFGDAGRDVKQKCAGRFCKTCIDRICYDRSYPLLRVTAGCPPAVCEESCDGFVYWNDQCPICRCRGFACREPCRTQTECPAGASCRNQVCVYAELPNQHFDKVCTFSSQCPVDQLCYNWRCGSKPAQSRHLEQSCANDHDCPSGHFCADMTCWQGEPARLRGQDCTLDHQCPAGYFCTNGKCTDVYHHGSFDSFAQPPAAEITTAIPSTTDRQCEHDQQCYGNERCWERRCVTVDEHRRIDEARRRQQTEHQSWRPQHELRPATAAAVPTSAPTEDADDADDDDDGDQQRVQVSADDEYQRRMAEYNRQVAEQERQYEERRRQTEEEARRREEAEAQRRRQEQEEADRHRQEQEADRRRQEAEAERRRQEDDQRRRESEEQQQRLRQQEDENQRRIREQEEARRRESETQNRLREQQEREQEAIRRRHEEEEAERRRQEEATRRGQLQPPPPPETGHPDGHDEHQPYDHHPEPEPDVEVGEEASEDGAGDREAEYERRMQEYNRQLKERQRQLQAEHEEEPEQRGAGGEHGGGADHSYPTQSPPIQAEVEVHDDEDDFYGRTRQRPRVGSSGGSGGTGENQDQAVSAYRVRYQRVSRRQ